MEISVAGRQMSVSPALKEYAQEKIGNAMKAMDVDPITAEVVLQRKKNPSIANPAICEVTMFIRSHIIRRPMTEEEALIQIDLLGHDFFGYIDRDTDTFRILYRRTNGGYGMLKQKMD